LSGSLHGIWFDYEGIFPGTNFSLSAKRNNAVRSRQSQYNSMIEVHNEANSRCLPPTNESGTCLHLD
jgi:hypothetical protein